MKGVTNFVGIILSLSLLSLFLSNIISFLPFFFSNKPLLSVTNSIPDVSPVSKKHKNSHIILQKHAQNRTMMDFHRGSFLNQTDVSFTLAKHMISNMDNPSNLVFSPLSIYVLLAMITSGSSGPTRDQMLGFLKVRSTEELNSLSSHIATRLFADGGPLGGPNLKYANGVWIDRNVSLKSTFKQVVEDVHEAAFSNVDFRNKAEDVRKEVNEWAEKETNGLIKELVPPGGINVYTMLILSNAIYFKGAWEYKFDVSLTEELDFFLSNGTSIQAPFMTSTKKQYVRAFDGFKVLQLPYKQGQDETRRFSMYIFLPDTKDGLPSLVEKISSLSGFIERHMPYQQVKLDKFIIPKFKVDFSFEASKVLKGLGVVLPFEGGLTEMIVNPTGGERLSVSSIFHKSFIEVNEEGTEAAAATTALLVGSSRYAADKLDFVADHPFMFVIREDLTGAVLFIGQILNPLAG